MGDEHFFVAARFAREEGEVGFGTVEGGSEEGDELSVGFPLFGTAFRRTFSSSFSQPTMALRAALGMTLMEMTIPSSLCLTRGSNFLGSFLQKNDVKLTPV